MVRVRITVTSVTTTALELVDDAGLDALSLSAVAKTLGVGPSALYTHCEGLDGLRGLVAVAATDNLAATLRNAAIGQAGDEALLALGQEHERPARRLRELGPHDRPDALPDGGCVEARCPVEAVAIGQGHHLVPQGGRLAHEIFRIRGAFEEGEGTAAAQLDVVGG